MKKNVTFNFNSKKEILSDQNISEKVRLLLQRCYGNEKPDEMNLRFLFDYANAFDYVKTKSIGGFDLFKN